MNIAAGAEILARAGEQYRTDIGFALTHHDGVAQRVEKFDVHAVGDIGPIERKLGDAVCNTQQNWSLVDHWQAHLSSVISPDDLT